MRLSGKNLGNCTHTSVVGAKLIRILAAIYNLLDGPYVKHISLTTLHSLHTQIIALMALNGTVGNLILRNQTQLWTCIKKLNTFQAQQKGLLEPYRQVDFTNEFTLRRRLSIFRVTLDETYIRLLKQILEIFKGFFPKDLVFKKRRL